MPLKLVSFIGLAVMIFIAWACSSHRRRFPWRTVLAGLALQFTFAVLILRTDLGARFFQGAQAAVDHINNFARTGAQMVFGPLANDVLLEDRFGPENKMIFAVTVTATIILVSALSSLLYHWRILQKVVRAMAWVMCRTMRTSGSESLSAAANIFMGQTESPLIIKPYLPRMTRSEMLAMMVGGMATIAGGVAAFYVLLGVSAGHLLAASVMSAPAALLIAKVMLPETEASETAVSSTAEVERTTVNSIDALCRGASEGMLLAINVIAMLIAFVALVALVNFMLGWVQQPFGLAQPIKLETLFGWINAPFAWLMGVPAKDCVRVGQFLGERVVLNEFIGYLSLTQAKGELDPRSFTLATYALCGFANFSSIAIQIGGIGSLAPTRREDLARFGWRALLGGLLACYSTACMVGILI